MLHMIKMAVGVRDIAHLSSIHQARLITTPPLRTQTRNMPKRAAEIIDGGSLYWVIKGAILVRQRITDIIRDLWDDGSPCTGLVLDSTLIRVAARSMKPFQGWRYLNPADAPQDLADANAILGEDDLPLNMRRALTELSLL